MSLLDVVRVAYDSLAPDVRIAPKRLAVRDGGNQLQEIEGSAAFVATPELVGVVGHSGSRDALIASQTYNRAGVAHIVPNATSRRLTTVGPWTFPLVPDDSAEGAFLAAYAMDSLHAARISVLYVGDEYGTGLRDGVRTHLAAHHRDVVDATMIPNESCNVPPMLDVHRLITVAALRRGRPDVVVVAAGYSNAACLTRIIASERPGTQILGADGFVIEPRQRAALPAEVAALVRTVKFWVPGTDSVNRVFVDRVRRTLHRDPTDVEALIYDGFMLMAEAVRDGGPSRPAVRRWLESLGHDRPPFTGVTGPISWDHGRVGLPLRLVPLVPAAR